MPYATESERELAAQLGYERETHIDFGDRFRKGSRHVWYAAYTFAGWQTADLIDGRFRNHQQFPTLAQAFNRPILESEP